MPAANLLPGRPSTEPVIYAYSEPSNPELSGLLKVGYTSRTVEERMHEHYPTLKPGIKPYHVEFAAPAMRADGTTFMDHEVHRVLVDEMRIRRKRDDAGKLTEWFACSVGDVQVAYSAVRDRTQAVRGRPNSFAMRPEQLAAVEKTERYFRFLDGEATDRTPKFLWNAKMRFGKTFASYQLARRMGFKRVLILTFKPAVKAAWEEDLKTHVDFEGWQFISRPARPGDPDISRQYEAADKDRPIVCFGSFQDFLGKGRNGAFKPQHEWVRTEDWDLVIFDEYHFGAWNENAKGLFSQEDDDERDTGPQDTGIGKVNTGNGIDEGDLPIFTRYYLFLSGTPFRALNSGEFIEEQIYNWTYSDEQAAKEAWPAEHPGTPNPYEALPRMVMLTYQMPEDIRRVAQGGEFNTFDLNVFFEATGEGDSAKFVLKDSVQKWLDLIRGAHGPSTVGDLKLGSERPAMPYSDARLLSMLNHTLWYLPRVSSCYAMRNLLRERQNTFFHDYTVNVCAGSEAGMGEVALDKVRASMDDPLESKTITLTCGKLTTGVTVKPWGGIFMLTNMRSPETYFQAAFRVQSPWTAVDDDGRVQVIKREAYVFDFSLDRSLRMVSDYSVRLDVESDVGPEQKVGEFIDFLPVLAYDGSTMREVSAAEILDMAMAGTSATLLARRWESALLVNVDNATLQRIIDDERAMDAIMGIEGFRALGDHVLETIVNKSEAVKKAKRDSEGDLTPKDKKQLTQEEKEVRSKRKLVQEKLIKFATRIPVFMYLTDSREQTLKDVIRRFESGLFQKVCGLTVEDFELLVSLGVFNDALMNDAIYKFRRYEDASLEYAGVNRHAGERVGLFDTSLSEIDYLQAAQEESMITPSGREHRIHTEAPEPISAGDVVVATVGETVAVPRDWITSEFASDNVPFVDRREKDGNLWVFGGAELRPRMQGLKDRGVEFTFSARGSKATGHRPGWWLKGWPAEVEQKPAASKVDEAALDALEPGDTVFHRAFGYGEVCKVDRDRGKIVIFLDGKERMFQFPGAFYQGLLTL